MDQQKQVAAYLGHTEETSQQDLEQQFLQSRRALTEFAAELAVVQQSFRGNVVNGVSRWLHHTASPHIWCEPGGAHLGGGPVTGKERTHAGLDERQRGGSCGEFMGRRKRWEFGILHEREIKVQISSQVVHICVRKLLTIEQFQESNPCSKVNDILTGNILIMVHDTL